MSKKIVSILLMLTFVCSLAVPMFALGQGKHDFSCDSFSADELEVPQGGSFTVTGVYGYTSESGKTQVIDKPGYYTEGTCGSCGGTGKKTVYDQVLVSCSACKGGGVVKTEIKCMGTDDNGNIVKCWSGCDGTDYKCSKCNYIARTGAALCPTHGQTCSIPWYDCRCPTGKYKNATCSKCGGEGQYYENQNPHKVDCDDCGGSGKVLYWHSPTYKWETVTAGAGDAPIEFYLNGVKQHTVSQHFEIGATATVKATLKVPSTAKIGSKLTVKTTINPSNVGMETNKNNNTKSFTVTVVEKKEEGNLNGDIIAPNSDYRKDTEVITSFMVRNVLGDEDIIPDYEVAANFRAINPNTGEVVATGRRENLVIPAKGSNLVFFKWHVPADYSADTVTLECVVNPEHNFDEIDYEDNIITGSNTVSDGKIDSVTPDTEFEKKAPDDFTEPSEFLPPDISMITPEDEKHDGSYEIWEWDEDTETIVKKVYGITLTGVASIIPDVNSPSHEFVDADDRYKMASGYGVSLIVNSELVPQSGFLPMKEEAYCTAQRALAFWPEYQYSGELNKFDVMELTGENKFELLPSAYSKNENGEADPRHIHFTPLWYPDGTYTAKGYTYDVWTPSGMLSITLNAPVTIDQSMYDDWYTANKKK